MEVKGVICHESLNGYRCSILKTNQFLPDVYLVLIENSCGSMEGREIEEGPTCTILISFVKVSKVAKIIFNINVIQRGIRRF